MNAKDVAHVVGADFFQSKDAEALLKPLTAGCFTKRGSWNARHFQLQGRELGFLGAKRRKRHAGFRQRSQTRDLLLDRGRYDRYVGARAGGHGWTTSSYNVAIKGV